MFYGFNRTALFTDGARSYMRLECFIVCPDSPVEYSERNFPGLASDKGSWRR